MYTDVLVAGAGFAGMVAALRAAEMGARVLLLAPSAPGTACNSAVSGGGFLMACTHLTVAEHRAITLAAGCAINQPELVDVLSQQAPACREWLESVLGFPLNVKNDGRGYWCPGGGARLSAHLAQAVEETERITVRQQVVRHLHIEEGACVGVVAEDAHHRTWHYQAAATVLATGGYAGLFARHDNPGAPFGAGVILAARAGARLRDLEFVQFYPVAVAEPTLPTFMLFRPFPPQVRLVTEDGRDLLEIYFDGMDLNEAIGSERDALSRVIHTENQRGQVYFDATACDWSAIDRWFSLRYISQYPFDWAHQRAKIAPIAHHTMGGIWIDAQARTSLPRLYACGEVAGGIHGANRHGSNSLTDCLVFGSVAAQAAASEPPLPTTVLKRSPPPAPPRPPWAAQERLQNICWNNAGIMRHASNLAMAREQLATLPPSEARLMAEAMVAFALRRTESRGAHFREDYPLEQLAWQHSQMGYLAGEDFVFEA